jgi:outer membrane protein W
MKNLCLLVAVLFAVSANAETTTLHTTGATTVTVDGPVSVTGPVPKKVHHKKKPAPVQASVPQNLLPVPSGAPVVAPPAPVKAAVKEEAPAPKKWTLGAAVGELSTEGGGSISGGATEGLIGSYKFNDHWALRADLDFSTFNEDNQSSTTSSTTTTTQVPNSCKLNPWTHKITCKYNTVTNSVSSPGDANSAYSQTDIAVGPTYRFLTSKFSPVLGLGLDYSHRYYNTSFSGSASSPNAGGNTDAINGVGLVGLDYRISDTVSVGLDYRYFAPIAETTDNPAYYPAGSQSLESQAYSTTTVNLQIHF